MRVTSAALLALSAAATASSATPTAPASHTVHVPIITNNGTGPQKHSLRVDPELTVPEIEEMAADFCTSHSVDQTHAPSPPHGRSHAQDLTPRVDRAVLTAQVKRTQVRQREID